MSEILCPAMMEPTGPVSSWPWGSGAILLVCGQRHHRCNPFESLLLLLLLLLSVPGESAHKAFRWTLLALLLLRRLSATFGRGQRSAEAELSKRKRTIKQNRPRKKDAHAPNATLRS